MSLVIAFRLLQGGVCLEGEEGRGGVRGLCLRERAAHMAVQVNGNHWLRLSPPLLDEADIFMYSSQLVGSKRRHSSLPRLCSVLILLEYLILHARPPSLSCTPCQLLFPLFKKENLYYSALMFLSFLCVCRCGGRSVLKSFWLITQISSQHADRKRPQSKLGEKQQC